MIIKKAVTGELDGKPALWLEGENGEIKRIARFDDEESYEDFLRCVEAGYFNSTQFNRNLRELEGKAR